MFALFLLLKKCLLKTKYFDFTFGDEIEAPTISTSGSVNPIAIDGTIFFSLIFLLLLIIIVQVYEMREMRNGHFFLGLYEVQGMAVKMRCKSCLLFRQFVSRSGKGPIAQCVRS